MARPDERLRQAYNELLDFCGSLPVGEMLPPEHMLALQLDVSRTVVRVALDRLQSNGILRWQGRDKTVLRHPCPEDRIEPGQAQISADALEARFLDWLLQCDLPPATPLNVTELCRRFAAPAHVVQELLGALSRFGIVKRRARGGWELAGFSHDFAEEVADFREMLELHAVSRLVALPPDHPVWPQLVTLRHEHEALAREISGRAREFPALDKRFHETIALAAPNRFGAEFRKVITSLFHYHYQWGHPDEQRQNLVSIAEHLDLIDALLGRDAQRAEAATRHHMMSSKQALLSSLHDPRAGSEGPEPPGPEDLRHAG